MQIRRLAMMLFCTFPMAALMYGCGSSSKEGSSALSDVATVPESSCRVCHSTSIEPVTGDNIVQDYLASAHNLVPGAKSHYPDGVGCQGCHGGGAQHNGVGPIPYTNPDASAKCLGCHSNYLPTAHRYTMTTAQQDPDAEAPAMYVSKNYENACTSCHDPHKADKGIGQEHIDWAASHHGDVNGAAWATEDFKENKSCIRCHTATGFKNYISSSWTLPSATWATAGDPTRQVLTCDACHSNYNFKNSVRTGKQFTSPDYKDITGVAAKFPDVGNSNICIACHTSRASGKTVMAIKDADISNTSFKNPHYLGAAGTMYVKTGFTDFVDDPATTLSGTIAKDTTGVTREFYYAESLTATDDGGQVGSTHRKFGTSAIIGDHGILATDTNMTTNGPCIVCHMNKGGGAAKHTLKIDTYAVTQVCIKCHATEVATSGVADADKLLIFLEEQKQYKDNAVALAAKLLKDTYQITVDWKTYPYFFDDQLGLDANGKPQGVKDWTRSKVLTTALTATNAKRLMGACFNMAVATKDAASYAHARTYTRRLLYDTIDFLDDNTMNRSVSVTAVNSGMKDTLNHIIFVKDTTAGGTTTESMKYLLGYNRTSLAWNNPERP